MNGDENKTVRQEMPSSVSLKQTAKGKWICDGCKLYGFDDEEIRLRLMTMLNFLEKEIANRNRFEKWKE